MTNKEKYAAFLNNTYAPVFSQPWWMDAVCGENNWDVYLVGDDNDLIAAMPYFITNRENMKLITKPLLTQNNGMIIRYPPNQKHCSRLDFEEKIINQACDFIEGLGIDRYEQQYHHSFTNWLPFYWRNYKAMPRYTYVIEDTSNMERVIGEFSANVRKNMNKAKRFVTVDCDLPAEDFYYVNKKSFDRQNLSVPFDNDFFCKFDQVCALNDAKKIFYAFDSDGNIHGVIYLVKDSYAVYPILGGADPKWRNSQAYTLLTYKSIEYASQSKLSFDFEGSMIKPIEHSFREYGGRQKLYFRIYKTLNPQIPEVLY